MFNEAEAIIVESEPEESSPVKSHTRKRKPRISIPADLPREDIIHDIPEVEKICPHDGNVLNLIGSEDHEQLEIIPAKIKVIRHKRLKYACPCCDQYIVTAHKPKQAIEKSIASPSLPYKNMPMPYRSTARARCSNASVSNWTEPTWLTGW